MIKCDPRAYAKCPDREKCGSLQNAIFTEGSDCDEFNQKVINAPPTNADRIRAMSDREIALAMMEFFVDEHIEFCQNKPECVAAMDKCDCVPDDKCVECLVAWLQQPAEEVQGDG